MTAPTARPAAPPDDADANRAALLEPHDTQREGTTMAARPDPRDDDFTHEMRRQLAEWRAREERRDAEAQVLASLPGEAWKPMEDRHTNQELARRVRLLERQVADTERQRDDYQRRWANAEIELGRLRGRQTPWWRR